VTRSAAAPTVLINAVVRSPSNRQGCAAHVELRADSCLPMLQRADTGLLRKGLRATISVCVYPDEHPTDRLLLMAVSSINIDPETAYPKALNEYCYSLQEGASR
jgi:hypothetical protein